MLALILLATSAISHFWLFGYPASVVFDEVHNGFYLNAYWHGMYFFDVHPPLAKIMTAVLGWLNGAAGLNTDWSSIGNPLPGADIALRILPAIFGVILPLVVYAILRRLNVSKSASFTAGIIVALENSLIVQSRFILFDVIMLVFGLSAILFYLEWLARSGVLGETARGRGRAHPALFLTLSVACAAAALSIKWTGASFLGLILLVELWRVWGGGRNPYRKVIMAAKRLWRPAAIYVGVAIMFYMWLFAIHFMLLPKSGDGDAFMTPSFQKSLVGNQYHEDQSITGEGFVSSFLELNKRMFSADESLTDPHPYSSRWYSWPFLARPIFYWQGSGTPSNSSAPENAVSAGNTAAPSAEKAALPAPAANSYIYYLGNPVAYWLGAAAIFILGLYWLRLISSRIALRLARRSGRSPEGYEPLITPERRASAFALVGFCANFLPFMFIGRVMFIYHYEAALIFSIMAIAAVIDILPKAARKTVVVSVIAITLSCFLYFAPLTYGTPLGDDALNQRMWLSTWR